MYIKRLAIKEVSWKYTNHIGLGSNIGATDKIGKKGKWKSRVGILLG